MPGRDPTSQGVEFPEAGSCGQEEAHSGVVRWVPDPALPGGLLHRSPDDVRMVASDGLRGGERQRVLGHRGQLDVRPAPSQWIGTAKRLINNIY